MAVYLYSGQEEFNIELEINALKAKLLDPEFKSINLRVYDNPNFNTLISAIAAQPLMFGNVMTIINCEKYLFTSRKSSSGADDEAEDDDDSAGSLSDKELKCIDEALSTAASALHIIFVAKSPRDKAKKVDTRKKIYKIITKYAAHKDFPLLKPYDKSLGAWIIARAKDKGLVISGDTAKFFIEFSGTNLRKLDTELEKLKIAIHPEKSIKREHIKVNCSREDDIFALVDHLIKGQKALALDEFNKICSDSHPLMVLSSLQTNLKNLISMKILAQSGMSAFEISKKTGKHEFVIKQSLEKLSGASLERLIKLKLNLTEAEFKMKTGKLEKELPIELALLS